MDRISPVVVNTPASPLLFNTILSLLEERKSFGDRRIIPHFEHPHGHPITDRRKGEERRNNFLNKEVFNRYS